MSFVTLHAIKAVERETILFTENLGRVERVEHRVMTYKCVRGPLLQY